MEKEREAVEEILPVWLTDAEKQAYGEEMAVALVEISRQEEELVFLKKHYKEGIEPLEDRVRELAARINDGHEERRVNCEIVKDFEAGTVTVWRLDTMEVVRQRDMTLEEKQRSLLQKDRETRIFDEEAAG